MKLTPCLAWVRRGVPALTPHKVKLSKEDLKRLIQGASMVSAESSESDTAIASSSNQVQRGLRGSRAGEKEKSDSDSDNEDDEEDGDPDKRYQLDQYDEEEASTGDDHLKGLATFATNEDDPYIGSHESDEEDEDFKLQPEDNLLLLGRVSDEEFEFEVYVYNETEGSFYIHHDYPLDVAPICMEPISYDPGADQQSGNLCAIGGLSSVIQLWDLDIVESMEPVGVLGDPNEDKTGKKKKWKKSKKSAANSEGESSVEPKIKKKKTISHRDAVLDLAWNGQQKHILASGSADSTVILWDIDTGQGSNVLSNHTDKVQGVEWHPIEDNLLLSGGCDGLVNLWDCRTCDSERRWALPNGEVEKVGWNTRDPFEFLAASDVGDIFVIDSRRNIRNGDCLEKAHNDAVSGLAIDTDANGCVATCGVDGIVKIWRVDRAGDKPLRQVTKKKLKLGKLFCCSFCPDNPWLLVVGGESEEGVYLWDIRKDEKVTNEWNVLGANSESQENENAEADDSGAEDLQ